MSQEEFHLKSAGGSEQPMQSAFAMTTKKETRDCFTYGEPGHISRFCNASIRGRGRGYNGGYNQRGGRGWSGNTNKDDRGWVIGPRHGEGAHRANMAAPSSLERDQKLLLQALAISPTLSTQIKVTHNASVAAHSINRGWVLDSGASKLKEFESYIRYPPHIRRLYIQEMAHHNLLEELGHLLLNYHQCCMCLPFL
jgi:hypothetical protein